MSQSLVLPWEVIERVIDHSAHSTVTLYSFTLTCRQLRPRSTILLLCRVQFKNRDQIFALYAILQARPHLQRCIRSVSIPASEFSPHPLLRTLPNLSEIEFPSSFGSREFFHRPLTLHPSTLKYCSLFGEYIQTLSLSEIRFTSLSAFSGILLAFPRLRSLSCNDLIIRKDSVHQDLIKRRLSERLHLDTLTISFMNDIFIPEVVKHTLTRLELKVFPESYELFETFLLHTSPMSDWVHLSSFTWRLDLHIGGRDPRLVGNDSFIQTIRILNDFRPEKLREVTVDISFSHAFRDLLVDSLPPLSGLCAELEKVLLTFPQSNIRFSPHLLFPLNIRRYHSWTRMLGTFFPALAERRALTIKAESCESSGQAGHDDQIQTSMVISADSRWAATGSRDGTIIIWDLESRCISQEWFAEDTGVDSLAFSPDTRYIMSASREAAARGAEGATVWDLHHDARKVRSLMAEDRGDSVPGFGIHCCAWSPDGTWIAAGPQPGDGTVHIWETTTFHHLHFHAAWKGDRLLAFSADGRWVVTADCFGDLNNCRIWNVESGKLHRSLQGHIDSVRAAAFDPGCTRVATGSDDSTIRVWDAETGEELLVLQEQATRQIDAVAFSGDGKMLLSHSSMVVARLYEDPLMDDDSGGVKVWDTSSGALLASLSDAPNPGYGPDPHFHNACFSPCGRYVASGARDGQVCLWRTTDWSCTAKLSEGKWPVTHVAISPDGRVLCWGTDKGTVFFRRMRDLVPAEERP